MKKKILLFLSVLLLVPSVVFAAKDIVIEIDGVAIKTEEPAIIDNDRTLVPIRFISEALKYEVDWDKDDREVEIERDEAKKGEVEKVELKIGSTKAKVEIEDGEDKIIELEVAPVIRNDRTYVPLRFISEAFGHTVNWNNDTRTVSIKTVK